MNNIHLTRTQVVQELTAMLRKANTQTTESITIQDKDNETTLVFPKKFNKKKKLQTLYSKKHTIMSQLRKIRSNLVRIYTKEMEEVRCMG